VLNSTRRPGLTLAATQAVCEGSAFLRNLFLARLIGADEMGLAVALALALRIFEMVGEFGLDRLLVQVEVESLAAARRAVHLLQLGKGLIFTVAAVLLAAPVSHALNPALDPSWFALAALSLALRGAANYDFRERQRRGEFLPALVVEGGSGMMAALAAIPLAFYLGDYTVLAWILVLQAGTFCALSHVVALNRYAVGIDRAVLSRCIRYGAPIALNGTLIFLALQGDRVIVAIHFTAAELARFALAAQLTLLPALIGARYILASELPRFARLARTSGGLDDYMTRRLKQLAGIALLGAIALGLCGNLLIAALYGGEYRIPPAVFWLLAVAAGLRLIRAVPSTALMALEKTRLLMLSNLPRLATLPVALFAVTLGGGLAAVAAIGVVGEALGLAVALFLMSASRSRFSDVAASRLVEEV
jgi:O-antigen/teichoic acid export membrane protein